MTGGGFYWAIHCPLPGLLNLLCEFGRRASRAQKRERHRPAIINQVALMLISSVMTLLGEGHTYLGRSSGSELESDNLCNRPGDLLGRQASK